MCHFLFPGVAGASVDALFTPPLNYLVVGHVGGRLAETDLSNLIKSLRSRAEESSEEILCLTGCSARILFLSLSRAVVAQTVSAHIHQTAGTVVLLKRDLDAETLSWGGRGEQTRLEEPLEFLS